MIRQFAALGWSLWMRYRIALTVILIGVPACLILVHSAAHFVSAIERIFRVLHLVSFFAVAYLLLLFSYTGFSSRQLSSGFPRHLFKLPLPTWLIALAPLFWGTLVIFIVCTVLLQIIITRPVALMDYSYLFLVIIVALSWVQLLSWGCTNRPIAAVIIILLVTIAVLISLTSVVSFSAAPLVPHEIAVVILVALAVAGVTLVFATVRQLRRGSAFGRGVFWGHYALPGFRFNLTSVSPERMQFNYEWRVFGAALPLVAAFLGATLFLVQLLPISNSGSSGTTAMAFGMFLYLAVLTGIEIAKSHWGAGNHRMSLFWATRPLSTAELAHAKLKVLALGVTVGTALCLVPLLCVWLLNGKWQILSANWAVLTTTHGTVGAVIILTMALGVLPVMAWIFSGNLLAISLVGASKTRIKLYTTLVCMILLAMALGLYITSLPGWPELLMTYYPKVFMVTAILAFVGSLILLRRFAQVAALRVVSGKALVTGVSTIVLVFASLQIDGLERQPFGLIALGITLSLLSFYPWLIAPLALHSNRHR